MKRRMVYLQRFFSALLYVFFATSALAQDQPFKRIIALSPHACEILYAIGAESQLVGGVSYCDYPKQAKALPRVGNYQRINVEAALRLKPDAVVVMSRQVTGVHKLAQLGVKIIVSNPLNFDMIFDDILKLGRLTGHRQQSQTLVNTLRQRLTRIEQAKPSHVRVFYEIWGDPLITAGKPSFITDLIEKAGGVNVFGSIKLESPHVNVEAVIRAKPDIIVIPQESRNIAERKAFWKKWLHGQAIRFVVVNPDLLQRPGPRLLDGLTFLHQAFEQAKASQVAQVSSP